MRLGLVNLQDEKGGEHREKKIEHVGINPPD